MHWSFFFSIRADSSGSHPSPLTRAELEMATSLPSFPWSTISHSCFIGCYSPGPFQGRSQGAVQPRREPPMKTMTPLCVFTGEETNSEAHVAYLGHIILLERPKTSMQHILLLGHNYLSAADAATWRLVQKGASCSHSISCILLPCPIFFKAGNPKDIGAGRVKQDSTMPKHHVEHSQIVFAMDTVLSASPEGSQLAVLGVCIQKRHHHEGREGEAFVLEKMMPSMQTKLQSTAGCRRHAREAQDKTCLLLTGWEHQKEQGWHTERGLSLLPPWKPKILDRGSALTENHQCAEVQWVWTGQLALVNMLQAEFPSAKHDQCQALHLTPTLPDGVLLIQSPSSS